MEDFLRSWMPLLVSIMAFGTSGWGILQGPARKNADAIKAVADSLAKLIDKLDARQDATEKEVALLKATVDHQPDTESFHRLENKVGDIAGDMKAITEAVRSVREIAVMTRDMVAKDAR